MSTYLDDEPATSTTPQPAPPRAESHYNCPKVRTYDILFAAFLLAKNVPLHHVYKGPQCGFFFDDIEGQATALKQAYFSDRHITIDARSYGYAMRKIKKIIRSWRIEQAREQGASEQGVA
jgi:hypothetical protein